VADTDTGQLRYDNYSGRWGNQEFLDQFLQSYAVEKAKIEARRRGHSVTEQRLGDGFVKLTVSVGGEA
jgi:GGDEF domain-containing protein